MFDFIGKHKRMVQVILGLITLPFAFFGVDYYFRQGGATPDVATVAGEKITQAEFNAALTEQQDRMRAQLGANYDPAMFDNPEVRFSVLEQVINRRLMQDVARANRSACPTGSSSSSSRRFRRSRRTGSSPPSATGSCSRRRT